MKLSCCFLTFIVTVFSAASQSAPEALTFASVFSPQEGLTKSMEKPWRQEICLNGYWMFQPIELPADYDLRKGVPVLSMPKADQWSATPIKIPSPWNVNAFSYSKGTYPSYPSSWEKARMGWLKKTFSIPENWKEKRVILHFEAICGSAIIVINGEQVAEHFDNSLPFDVDITDFLMQDKENTLLVGVRQATLFDVPGMFGQHTYPSGSPWTRQMIGIWQDVYLRALPPLRAEEIVVRPLVDKGILELEVTVRNSTGLSKSFSLGGDIRTWINQAGKDLLTAPVPAWSLGNAVIKVQPVELKIGPRTTIVHVLRIPIKNELKFWTSETPELYALLLDVLQTGETIDRYYQRFGWRQWGISGKDVTLNGKTYQLFGESGHLLGIPYMTRRYAWSWYKAIKDMNGNAIRLHANIRPRFYLELAEEMGIAIMDESEIYASTMEINYNAPETWQRFHDHIDGMVKRDRNYACVFGWSIANEILSALWWKGIPRKFWPPVIDKVVALADRVRALDPTRAWISSDGDGDFHGRLPTYVYHYGKPQDWNRQAPKDKPFGIGEGGSMLWGSPAVFSVYNGERSYESHQGMLEGTAIEIYWYLVEQRKISAFLSIFTAAGACFQPMNLGVNKTGVEGSIRLAPYVEGQPGMQPEQMGTWHSFNPGYDPALPLYKTTPVFDAMKAAYAPGKPLASPWDHRVQSPPLPAAPAAKFNSVQYAGSENSELKKSISWAGVPIDKETVSGILVIDGSTATDDQLISLRNLMKQQLSQKGTVMIWVNQENLQNVNKLLPDTVSLIPQSAFSLYADRKAVETASISLADLFFLDQSDKTILKYGLAGPLVSKSQVLMESNSFTQRWMTNEQELKTPAMIRFEQGGGRVIVTSLSPDVRSAKRLKLMRSLFTNLEVKLAEPDDQYDSGFDGAGFVNQALVIGSFQGAKYPEILDKSFLPQEARADPKPGDTAGQRVWTKMHSMGDGLFDFFRLGIPGTENSRLRTQGPVLKPEALDANNYLEVIERVSGTNPGTNSVAYLSFWVQSPKDLDSSQIRMLMRSDDGAKVWVNQQLVFEERKIYGPGITEPKAVPMTLKKGWNHVFVKVGQLDGPWMFGAKFESGEKGVVEEMRVRDTNRQ